MALDHIGARSNIASLEEDSQEAAKCRLWYDSSRLQVLEGAPWSFATARTDAVVHASAPPPRWSYRYEYPINCVRVRSIGHIYGQDAPPFAIELADDGTQSVLTSAGEAQIVYTFDQENTELFSPRFAEALAWHLASQIATSLTANPNLSQAAAQRYALVVESAAGHIEGQRNPDRDAPWVRGR